MKAPAVDQQGSTCAADSLEHPGTKRKFWLLLFGLTLLYVFVPTMAIVVTSGTTSSLPSILPARRLFNSSGTKNSSSRTIRQLATC